MRTILITGCSTGIGRHAAQHLHANGWRVLASCRKQDDADRLRAEGLTSFRLDYEDPASIAEGFAQAMELAEGRLDALFNNGAYGIPGAVEDLPVAALKQIFEANFFGWHDLTRRAISVMRPHGRGRIIQCSSVLGISAMPWRGAYNATKFALEGLTDTLRMEMAGTGIQISLIEPGPIKTDFRRNARLQFDRWIDWQASPRAAQYKEHLLPRLYNAGNDEKPDRFELPPEAVTQKLCHALTARRARAHYYVTTPTYIAATARRLLPTWAQDRLWRMV